MSELEKLVSDIGYQVGLLTNQLEEEKAFLSEIQNRFQSISKDTQAKRDAKHLLEEEIRHLEQAYFRQTQNCTELENTSEALKKQNRYLEAALVEIQKSNEKLRQERAVFVSECRRKLKEYDDHLTANEKLRTFVNLWKAKRATNHQLTDLPDTIRDTARKLVGYYDNPLEPTLSLAVNHEMELCSQVQTNEDRTNAIAIDLDSENIQPQVNAETSAAHMITDNSDLIMDSQMVDSSRLRVSVLDTSILPQKDFLRSEKPLQDHSVVELNISEPSGDATSY